MLRPLILILASLVCVSAPVAAETISLNGDWSFVTDSARSLKADSLDTAEGVRTARVPGSWQAQFDDLRDYAGVAWYWRSVNVSLSAGRVALLRFGAVDYRADVFVNGERAGTHDGGYLPFELDVTTLLKPGGNHVALRVADAGGGVSEVEGIKFREIPHGKQDWYVQTSGPWQDVEIDIRPQTRIGNVHISAAADGRFTIDVPIIRGGADSTSPVRVHAAIVDRTGKTVWERSAESPAGEARQKFAGQVSNPRLWNLETPTLYTLRVESGSGDAQSISFGFRTFEARAGRFYLNGTPIYQRGALDQDFYPDTIYSIPSFDYVKSEMLKARALGLNLLRHHIKVPDPRYLQAADEAGVLIWYDVPNWDTLTDASRRRGLETLRGMVDRDWNHPSIVALTVINEAWGMDIRSEAHRAWLSAAFEEAKAIVPGWLVVDNSPCCDNYHLTTDIADFHQYNVIPDHAATFRRIVRELAKGASWLFSPHGDAARRGDEPLVLSEFGNWGLPRVPAVKPWWWGRPFRDNPITLPDGIEDRFRQYGFGSVFRDLGALTDATQWHQYRALKHEIETLRAEGTIQGYVITEFTDINWEANGLLDMWRRPKLHATELAKLQQDDVLIVGADRRSYRSGDSVRATVRLSRYGASDLGDSVTWTLDGFSIGGKLRMPRLSSGAVVEVGTIAFQVPPVAAPARHLLVVRGRVGEHVSVENSMELFFYPPPPNAASRSAVAIHDPPGRLRWLSSAMTAQGYRVEEPGAGRTMVASAFDQPVRDALRSGSTVVLLPGPGTTSLAPGLEVVSREGSSLDGNWITSFLWVRKDLSVFAPIAFDPLSGFEVESAVPESVVRGVPAEHFGDVLSGIFYGWLHSNVATLVQASAGRGRVIICTFDVADSYGRAPYATHFWDGLLQHASSSFQPAFRIPIE